MSAITKAPVQGVIGARAKPRFLKTDDWDCRNRTDLDVGMQTILDGLCQEAVSTGEPAIPTPVMQAIKDCELGFAKLTVGFDAMDHIWIPGFDSGATRGAFDQLNNEHIGLTHQWCDVTRALGLDPDTLNNEAVAKL